MKKTHLPKQKDMSQLPLVKTDINMFILDRILQPHRHADVGEVPGSNQRLTWKDVNQSKLPHWQN